MIQELILNHSWLLYTGLGLLSLMIGSFLNVVIYRVPVMLMQEWKQQCCELLVIPPEDESRAINLFLPRSFCPQCKTLVKSWQNIPIISYLCLRGRCYQCQLPISIRYPLIEMLTLILSLFASWHFGFTIECVFVILAIWILIPLFFIDLEHQILPDSLTLGLLWVGLIANTQNLFCDLPTAIFSTVGAYMGLWIFIQIFYLITGKIGMGHGDFKLFAAFAAWFGWTLLPLILLFSSISGAVVGLAYLNISKKTKDTPIPFGPFLCVGGLIALFWGQEINHWYLHTLSKY